MTDESVELGKNVSPYDNVAVTDALGKAATIGQIPGARKKEHQPEPKARDGKMEALKIPEKVSILPVIVVLTS